MTDFRVDFVSGVQCEEDPKVTPLYEFISDYSNKQLDYDLIIKDTQHQDTELTTNNINQ